MTTLGKARNRDQSKRGLASPMRTPENGLGQEMTPVAVYPGDGSSRQSEIVGDWAFVGPRSLHKKLRIDLPVQTSTTCDVVPKTDFLVWTGCSPLALESRESYEK
jgi:hypothetical protein